MLASGRRHAAAASSATALLGLVALAAPASAAAASTVVQVKAGELRLDGVPGTPSSAEVRYRTAAEAGGVSDRFVVQDPGGAEPLGADCAAIDPITVSCDARPVISIAAALGDGDDVMVVNAGKGDGVPSRYRAKLRGQIGADVLRGGLADDVLRGDRGRDVVAGWSGDDRLFGGNGSDGLIGFTGNDTLYGDKGRDALFGQKGRDLMFGGPQNDVLLARDGFRDPQISCGPGKRQEAVTDRRDPRPRRCLVREPKGKRS
ncbi:MAG: calcium-binding protein [Solirubrobacterales bacterium]